MSDYFRCKKVVDNNDIAICPFNKTHHVQKRKLQYHIMKCAKNHPDMTLVICPFDASHRVLKSEFKYHLDNCPNKQDVEGGMFYLANEESLNFKFLTGHKCNGNKNLVYSVADKPVVGTLQGSGQVETGCSQVTSGSSQLNIETPLSNSRSSQRKLRLPKTLPASLVGTDNGDNCDTVSSVSPDCQESTKILPEHCLIGTELILPLPSFSTEDDNCLFHLQADTNRLSVGCGYLSTATERNSSASSDCYRLMKDSGDCDVLRDSVSDSEQKNTERLSKHHLYGISKKLPSPRFSTGHNHPLNPKHCDNPRLSVGRGFVLTSDDRPPNSSVCECSVKGSEEDVLDSSESDSYLTKSDKSPKPSLYEISRGLYSKKLLTRNNDPLVLKQTDTTRVSTGRGFFPFTTEGKRSRTLSEYHSDNVSEECNVVGYSLSDCNQKVAEKLSEHNCERTINQKLPLSNFPARYHHLSIPKQHSTLCLSVGRGLLLKSEVNGSPFPSLPDHPMEDECDESEEMMNNEGNSFLHNTGQNSYLYGAGDHVTPDFRGRGLFSQEENNFCAPKGHGRSRF